MTCLFFSFDDPGSFYFIAQVHNKWSRVFFETKLSLNKYKSVNSTLFYHVEFKQRIL